jgi:hypothetical protein
VRGYGEYSAERVDALAIRLGHPSLGYFKCACQRSRGISADVDFKFAGFHDSLFLIVKESQ